jgi:zinc transporter ZupT
MIEGFWIGVGFLFAKLAFGLVAIAIFAAIALALHLIFERGDK